MSKIASSPSRVEKTETGLRFSGVIDYRSVPALLKEMPKPAPAETVLDLSEITRIDSAGLAFLIHWANQNLSPDQKIPLCGANTKTRKLIDIMRLKSIFELQA